MRISTYSPVAYAFGLCSSLVSIGPPGVLMRLGIILALLPAIVLLPDWKPARPERPWILAVVGFFVAQLVSAFFILAAPDVDGERAVRVILDCGRQLFLAGTAVLLVRILRRGDARARLCAGLTILSILASALILLAYGKAYFAGTADQEFKIYAATSLGVPVNPLSTAALLGALLGYGYWGTSRGLTLLVVATVGLTLVVSGARATLAAALAAAVALTLSRIYMKGRRAMAPLAMLLGSSVLIGAACVAAWSPPDASMLSDITTGRLDLWVAGWSRFLERPLSGSGAGSWYYDLQAYLPGYYRWGDELLADGIGSGGYHNAYLGLLADKGGVSGLAALILLATAAWVAVSVRRRKNHLAGTDARIAEVAPMFVAAVLVRAMFESSGLLGGASGLVDFLEYTGVGLFVATLTHARACAVSACAVEGRAVSTRAEVV